ncbi:cyclin-B1-4-like isoform X2 [Camellia sinensis]|uniref:cyclin-B1-4-like isoform X2 n=1 Tax=Camellia sinensis TaxID=4442 RepID=UPI001035DF82|nr:cyclin-B1-4-like isoform X2 [Camellia sinensis]
MNFFYFHFSDLKKPVAVIARKSRVGSSRNEVKTLTSILTARSKPEINSKMRSILIDWLTEVHRMFELMPETLYLTINIVDRYLSMNVVPRRELQLVGISSMLIACKYEEIWAPEVKRIILLKERADSRCKRNLQLFFFS